jgi:hypothetical protein
MKRWQKGLVVAIGFSAALLVVAFNLLPEIGAAAWAAGFCDACPDADAKRIAERSHQIDRDILIDGSLLLIGLAGGTWCAARRPNPGS